jgi:hypothetical protein
VTGHTHHRGGKSLRDAKTIESPKDFQSIFKHAPPPWFSMSLIENRIARSGADRPPTKFSLLQSVAEQAVGWFTCRKNSDINACYGPGHGMEGGIRTIV